MTAFPSITPTTRSYSSGFQPTTKHISISGYETRVTTGSTITQRRLEMTFENISDTKARLIEDHYKNRNGEARTFKLSAANLDGVSGTSWKAYTWRYAAPITITQTTAARMTVSVQLVSVF